MLLSLFHLEMIHNWLILVIIVSFGFVVSFFWIIRMTLYRLPISKHSHSFFTYAFVSVSFGNDAKLVNTCNYCFFQGWFFLFLDFTNNFIPATYIKAFTFLFYVCFLSLFHLEKIHNWLILTIIVSFGAIFSFFWTLRMNLYRLPISKYSYSFFTYAFVSVSFGK